MPAKSTTDFSVTIRFGVPIRSLLSQENLSKYFATLSNKYAIAYEQNEGPDSGHWQCGIILNTETRQDKLQLRIITALRKMMVYEWSDDNVKYAVKVRAHNDIYCLIGGYLTKDDASPLIVGIGEHELVGTKERYEIAKADRLKKLPVSKSALTPLLKQYYDRIYSLALQDSEKLIIFERKKSAEIFSLMESLILGDGYDLSECLQGAHRNYLVRNFDQIFSPKSSQNILDNFFLHSR